jgi:dTDP-4-amino-4,6-dideoxy-D-galactose acyltransferase
MNPEFLEWDSDFFNMKVGRMMMNPAENFSANQFNDFDLVYLVFQNELPAELKLLVEKEAFFADEKLTYKKDIGDVSGPDTNILSWPSDKEVSKELLEIGVGSGDYSRFKIDPLIPANKFTALYQTWIINSVKRLIAEEVYYYNLDGQTAGIITLGMKNGIPDIGILSVDKRFRGKQIATKLVNAAEYWAKKYKGFDTIQVVTQGPNKVACSFYEKCGFKVTKSEFIFHWWKKNQKI